MIPKLVHHAVVVVPRKRRQHARQQKERRKTKAAARGAAALARVGSLRNVRAAAGDQGAAADEEEEMAADDVNDCTLGSLARLQARLQAPPPRKGSGGINRIDSMRTMTHSEERTKGAVTRMNTLTEKQRRRMRRKRRDSIAAAQGVSAGKRKKKRGSRKKKAQRRNTDMPRRRRKKKKNKKGRRKKGRRASVATLGPEALAAAAGRGAPSSGGSATRGKAALQRCSSVPSMRSRAFDLDDEDDDEDEDDEEEEQEEDRATVFARLRGQSGHAARRRPAPRVSVASVGAVGGPMLRRHSSLHSMRGTKKKKKTKFGRRETPAPPQHPRTTRFRKTRKGQRSFGGGSTLLEAIHEPPAEQTPPPPRPSQARASARIVGTVRAAAMFKASLKRQRSRKAKKNEHDKEQEGTRRGSRARSFDDRRARGPPPKQSFAGVVGTMRAASRIKKTLERQRAEKARRQLEKEQARKQPTVAELTSAAAIAAKARKKHRATTKASSFAGQEWMTPAQARAAERGGGSRYKSPHEQVPHPREWAHVHRKKDRVTLFSELQ